MAQGNLTPMNSPPADATAEANANQHPLLHWQPAGVALSARWRSERGDAPPAQVVLADDTLPANTAYRLACEGSGLLWQGDFVNARHLLQALVRRVDKPPRRQDAPRSAPPARPGAATEPGPEAGLAFHRHRQRQSRRAQVLSQLLIPLAADGQIPLRRAPDVRAALIEAWGPLDMVAADAAAVHSVVSLRELLGLISAHEWRKKGVPVAALGHAAEDRIHPHYGVFSPVRGEYVDLVAQAPLPAALRGGGVAVDIGTGTGVLAAVLARRGVQQVLATDTDPRALACARANLQRLGLGDQVQVLQADLFPAAPWPPRAALLVCNPPWLPVRPGAALERAVYDEDSRMLLGFLNGLAAHLEPGGEGWLILSDLAEHLGLRPRAWLQQAIAGAGLRVLGRIDTRPTHRKAFDASDALHAARAAEVTSLWRLGVA